MTGTSALTRAASRRARRDQRSRATCVGADAGRRQTALQLAARRSASSNVASLHAEPPVRFATRSEPGGYLPPPRANRASIGARRCAAALVGVGDDPGLERRGRRAQRVERGLREPRHRVVTDRRRELRVAVGLEPGRRPLAVPEVGGHPRRAASLSTSWSSAAVSTSAPVDRVARSAVARRARKAATSRDGAGVAHELRRRRRASAAGGRPRGGRGSSWAGSYRVGAAQAADRRDRDRPAGAGARPAARARGRPAATRPGSGSRTGRRPRRATRPVLPTGPRRRRIGRPRRPARRPPRAARPRRPARSDSSISTEPSWSVRQTRAPRVAQPPERRPAPGARTGCRRRPRRPRPAAGRRRRTPGWSRSRCRGGRP